MGKNTKEQKAFSAAEKIRTTFIDQLKRCKSLKELEGFLKKYEEKKSKSTRTVNLTDHHQKTISDLDVEIAGLILKLKQRFTPVTQIEPVASIHVHHEEERGRTEVLPVAKEESEKQHVGTKAEVTVDAASKPSEEHPKTSLTISRGGEKRHRPGHQGMDRRGLSRPSSVEIQQTGHDSGSVKKHHSHVDSRTRRHREIHLSEVRLKLKTLHAKEKKYKEKAKEYHGKDQVKEKQYKAAEAAAGRIHQKITKFCNQYILDGNWVSFKLQSQGLLSKDSADVKTLKTHRGWWEKFLDDLVELINKGFVRVGSSIRVGELSIFKPAADGGKKIDALANTINSVQLP